MWKALFFFSILLLLCAGTFSETTAGTDFEQIVEDYLRWIENEAGEEYSYVTNSKDLGEVFAKNFVENFIQIFLDGVSLEKWLGSDFEFDYCSNKINSSVIARTQKFSGNWGIKYQIQKAALVYQTQMNIDLRFFFVNLNAGYVNGPQMDATLLVDYIANRIDTMTLNNCDELLASCTTPWQCHIPF